MILDFLSKFSMQNFGAIARYKRERRVLLFTVLTSWELVLAEICKWWDLEVFHARVKFVMHDAHRLVCAIESKVDFQRICHIYHILNCPTIDLVVDTDKKPLVFLLALRTHDKYRFFHIHVVCRCWFGINWCITTFTLSQYVLCLTIWLFAY